MEKTNALSWWNGLTVRVKWDLFFKYNPEIGNAPASIGLDLNHIEKSHIVEIWCKENNLIN